MPPVKDFMTSLETMAKVHESKNSDYATEDNAFFNFDVQQYIMGLFNDPRDKVFASMVGIKLARLANLLNKNGEAKNEAVEDTFIDLPNYVLLWKADRAKRIKSKPTDQSVNLKVDQIKSRT